MLKYKNRDIPEVCTGDTELYTTWLSNDDGEIVINGQVYECFDVVITVADLDASYTQPNYSSWESDSDYYGGWDISHGHFAATLQADDIITVEATEFFTEDELVDMLYEYLEG